MKTMNMIGLLLTVALFTMSCEKYEDGGPVSKTEKNLKTTWKLQKYLRNGTDETALLIIKNYEESYSGSNSYSRSYIDEDNETVSENGAWNFDKDQKKLNISGVGSIDLTDETGTISSSDYNILKLDEEEFWYYYVNGGDRHEFHLVVK